MSHLQYSSIAGFRVDVDETPTGALVSIAIPEALRISRPDATSIAGDAVRFWRGEGGDQGTLEFLERTESELVFRWAPSGRRR